MILMSNKFVYKLNRNISNQHVVWLSEELRQYPHYSLLEDYGRDSNSIVATTFTASDSRNGKDTFY